MSESKNKERLRLVLSHNEPANGASNVDMLMGSLRGKMLLDSFHADPNMKLDEEQFNLCIAQLKHQISRDAKGKHFGGKYNMYVCEKCNGHILTQDQDIGVTPFMIKCKDPNEAPCDGAMKSCMYMLPQHILAVSKPKVFLKWRYPRYDEWNNLETEYQRHIMNGGLVPVTGE